LHYGWFLPLVPGNPIDRILMDWQAAIVTYKYRSRNLKTWASGSSLFTHNMGCPNSGVPPGYLIASNGWCPTVFPHSICAILVSVHWTDGPQAWELATMFLVRLYKNPKPDNEGPHSAVHTT
jgi:hypothetical protein